MKKIIHLLVTVLILSFFSLPIYLASTKNLSSIFQTSQGDTGKKPDLREVLLGAWQATATKGLSISFQDRKLTVVEDGKLTKVVLITTYKEGVVLCAQGIPLALDITVEAQKLKLHCKNSGTCAFLGLEQDSFFEKLQTIPSQHQPEALVLGKSVNLSEKRIMEIKAELAERLKTDQGVRQNQDTDYQEMERVDTDNTAYLKTLLSEVGWIYKSQFGEEASKTAFLIVQHSGDIPLMMAALSPLKEENQLSIYALLYDRIQIFLAEKQLYGSQLFRSEEGLGGIRFKRS